MTATPREILVVTIVIVVCMIWFVCFIHQSPEERAERLENLPIQIVTHGEDVWRVKELQYDRAGCVMIKPLGEEDGPWIKIFGQIKVEEE